MIATSASSFNLKRTDCWPIENLQALPNEEYEYLAGMKIDFSWPNRKAPGNDMSGRENRTVRCEDKSSPLANCLAVVKNDNVDDGPFYVAVEAPQVGEG